MEQWRYDWVLIQPTSGHEDLLAIEQGVREQYRGRFKLVGFHVDDWDADLSPWYAPAVFGKNDFRGGAGETLHRLEESVAGVYKAEAQHLCIGGYSMAGLFALFAAMWCWDFDAVCAVSPSVWFPGWKEFADSHPVHVERAYISLGDREHRLRNPLVQQVHDCVQHQYDLFPCSKRLDWNEGTHFNDPVGRMVKGYLWTMSGMPL